MLFRILMSYLFVYLFVYYFFYFLGNKVYVCSFSSFWMEIVYDSCGDNIHDRCHMKMLIFREHVISWIGLHASYIYFTKLCLVVYAVLPV